MTKAQKLARDEMRDRLRSVFPQGSEVFTSVVHVVPSGMARDIVIRRIVASDSTTIGNYSFSVALLLKLSLKHPQGIPAVRITGAGMSMTDKLVEDLAYALYADEKALRNVCI